jgi:hypothetical protein
MKSKGKMAWLITWEGPEAEDNGRCKVVTILRPQFGRRGVAHLLPILFSSECNYTLCEKTGFGGSVFRDSCFRETYRDINPELWYGHFPKDYLCARQVKNLRCEKSKRDYDESTLYWTELPKFIPNPKYGPEGSPFAPDRIKEVIGERDLQYTYSIRPAIELEKARRAKRKLVDND